MFGQVKPSVKNLLTVGNSWSADQRFIPVRRATSSTTSQSSAAIVQEASGWNTTTSTQANVLFKSFTQGASAAGGSGKWVLQQSLNNASYSDAIAYDIKGALSNTLPLATISASTRIQSNHSSAVHQLLSLQVDSTGTGNQIGMSFSGTTRAAWAVNTSGNVQYYSAGSSTYHYFYVGTTISSQSLMLGISTFGAFNNGSFYNAGKVAAGNLDFGANSTLATYGSFAAKGTFITESTTLDETYTFVYVDPSNSASCVGTATSCSTYTSQVTCDARVLVGCSWSSGSPCSDFANTSTETCTSQGTGSDCTWGSVSCSSGNNTSLSYCESLDDTYGGSCTYDSETICPSLTGSGEAACEAVDGCTYSIQDCSDFNGSDQFNCEVNTPCVWSGDSCRFPSKADMAKNLAFSFVNVVGEAFKTGKVVASKEMIGSRMSICNCCEFKLDSRCSKCGCVLAYKVGLHAEKCPEEKW